VLLLIPGGPADAAVFAGLAPFLTDRYTVMPYDPRGNSRSLPDDPTADQDLDVHGDDAAALLAAVTDQPAYVLGNSGGAQIGLNLAARHPTRVHTLVAHEPPCAELLPDADKLRAAMEDVYQTYRSHGVEAGMQRFRAGGRPTRAAPGRADPRDAGGMGAYRREPGVLPRPRRAAPDRLCPRPGRITGRPGQDRGRHR
jgi:pimeloyl-ACP methyl ester carboxylesterase